LERFLVSERNIQSLSGWKIVESESDSREEWRNLTALNWFRANDQVVAKADAEHHLEKPSLKFFHINSIFDGLPTKIGKLCLLIPTLRECSNNFEQVPAGLVDLFSEALIMILAKDFRRQRVDVQLYRLALAEVKSAHDDLLVWIDTPR